MHKFYEAKDAYFEKARSRQDICLLVYKAYLIK